MRGELSHGLPRLTAETSHIVTAAGERVMLRGINRSGLEYSEPDDDSFVSAAGMSGFEFQWIASNWKANIVRIPFNQDWALNGRKGKSSEDYLRDLDRVVTWASASGMYTLLDLHWLNADHPFGPDRQFVPPLPNSDTTKLWGMLAERYRDEPAVMFDLFNEPHDRGAEDRQPLWRHDGTYYPPDHRTVGMAEWKPWAELLVDVVRSQAAATLVFVSGTNWGYDLRGFPLDRENIVYSTHVYSNKGTDWQGAFGDLSNFKPVFVGEFGGWNDDVAWGRRLLDFLGNHRIGWAAWGWPDEPSVVKRYGTSPFGAMVVDRLGKGSGRS